MERIAEPQQVGRKVLTGIPVWIRAILGVDYPEGTEVVVVDYTNKTPSFIRIRCYEYEGHLKDQPLCAAFFCRVKKDGTGAIHKQQSGVPPWMREAAGGTFPGATQEISMTFFGANASVLKATDRPPMICEMRTRGYAFPVTVDPFGEDDYIVATTPDQAEGVKKEEDDGSDS
jgi:hypothetical protein